MAGNANSGRRPMLSDMTVEEILKLSSTILLRWLSNTEVTDATKIPVIAQFISKRIPATTIIEGDVKGPTQIVVVRSKEEIADTTKEVSRQVPIQ